jgi:uncharacterized membrane protein YqjE
MNGRAPTVVRPPGPAVDPTRPIEGDRSLGELFARLGDDFGTLVSTQVELARIEIREEAARAGKAAGMLSAGAAFGWAAVLILSVAAALGLAEVMPEGWAFAIVGAVHAAIAAVLLLRGRERLQQVAPIAPVTKETIKEDVQWARQQRS